MFNLIVLNRDWEDDNHFHLDEDRFLEFTNLTTLYEIGFIDLSSINWNIICSLPTLFLREGTENTPVFFGHVISVTSEKNVFNVEYQILHPFPDFWPTLHNKTLIINQINLGIKDLELNRTHWAIKQYNLIKFLYNFEDEIPF